MLSYVIGDCVLAATFGARAGHPPRAALLGIGGDERDVWKRADSSRQGLNGHRQVYSHLCLIPSKGRNLPFESQPVLDMCANPGIPARQHGRPACWRDSRGTTCLTLLVFAHVFRRSGEWCSKRLRSLTRWKTHKAKRRPYQVASDKWQARRHAWPPDLLTGRHASRLARRARTRAEGRAWRALT